MRAFLLPLTFVLLVATAPNTASSHQPQSVPGGLPEIIATHPQRGGDTVRMWKRAEIRVIPMDVVAADRAELEALRERVSRAESDIAKLAGSNFAVQQQFSRDLQLMESLLRYAERQDSDRGKGPTAIAVERNLNHLQGQMMCEACHTRAIAASIPGSGPGAQ